MAAVANKDPAIKLFGKTISFSDDSRSLDNGSSLMEKQETEEYRTKNSSTLDETVSFERCNGEQAQPHHMKQPSTSQAITKPKVQEEESDDGGESKPMRRPDKILTCPRCNSLDTKFCYFNNYNVNQPRHFCKSCQRYWTAGGTVRNVPIGAGRRRNKQLASQYRQIISPSDVSPAMVTEGTDSANQLLSCEESTSSCTTSSPNEMVLKFGPESPHFDNLPPNLLSNRESNGCSEIDLSNTSGSSPQHLYHYIAPSQIASSSPHSSSSAPFGVPRFASPNISYQIVPAAYMNCIPVWVTGSGNISLAVPDGCVSSSFVNSGNRLQVLGKHSRDTYAVHEGRIQETLSAPKILRTRELDQE